MAQNQYRQQWHQGGPVRQEYNGAETGQRGWRSEMRDAAPYNQRNPQQGWRSETQDATAYSQRNPQQGWRSGTQDATTYNQRNPQQGWKNGSDGYDNSIGAQTYQQDGRWEDPYYQDQYQEPPRGPGPQNPHNPAQASGRSYHYDDRFHNGGYSQNHQTYGVQDGYMQRSQEKHRPHPMDVENRQKSKLNF